MTVERAKTSCSQRTLTPDCQGCLVGRDLGYVGHRNNRAAGVNRRQRCKVILM